MYILRSMNLSLLQRVSLGFGGGINSIKTDFFAFFLGFFYLTFLGLDPLLTGTALLIALIFDAFFDPIIGILSDRIKSKFGRRHVFMSLSIIPSAFFYMMIFIPNPDWSQNQIGLFFWLLTSVILTRFFVSIFDIPHRALFAELGRSYFNNAKVMSSREGYQWIIAAIHSLVVYTFLGYYEDDPDKWKYIGLFGAGLMIIFGFLSFFGSKILIPKLYSWSNKGANYINFSKIKSELGVVIQNKSLLIFLLGSLFIQASWGLANSLSFLTFTSFWDLTPLEIRFFIYAYLFSTVISWQLTPRLIQHLDKEKLVILCLILLSITHSLPFLLFKLNYLNNDDQLDLVIFFFVIISLTGIFSLISLMTRESMIPDIIDQVYSDTKYRQEGAVSSITSFCSKCMSGVGKFISMFLLWIIEFPAGNSTPTQEQLDSLLFIHGPLVSLFFLIPMLIFTQYALSRKIHHQITTKSL
tara:strand:- start:45119 stop:46522 length:1404 start_codon:yes stop_codon:yes gene_type:complete